MSGGGGDGGGGGGEGRGEGRGERRLAFERGARSVRRNWRSADFIHLPLPRCAVRCV